MDNSKADNFVHQLCSFEHVFCVSVSSGTPVHYEGWNVRVYFDKNLYTIFAGEHQAKKTTYYYAQFILQNNLVDYKGGGRGLNAFLLGPACDRWAQAPPPSPYTDKKENQTNGLLIYGEIFPHFFSYIRKPFLIYDFATAPL